DHVGYFNNGLALAMIDSMYGYIDKAGEFVIPPQYNFLSYLRMKEPIRLFSDAKYKSDSLIQFIKDKPDSVFNYGEFYELQFYEEKAVFLSDSSRYGFIDKSGNIVINPIFLDAHRFSEGLAGVAIRNDSTLNIEWGFVDEK